MERRRLGGRKGDIEGMELVLERRVVEISRFYLIRKGVC